MVSTCRNTVQILRGNHWSVFIMEQALMRHMWQSLLMVQVQIHDCHIVYQFWSFNSYSASEHVCVKNLQEWAFVGCIVIVPYRANHNDEVQKPPEYMKCSCFASTMTISTTILQNDCCKILSQLLHRECSESWNFTALYCISTLIACRSKITKMFFYQTRVNAYSKAFPKYKVCNPWWEREHQMSLGKLHIQCRCWNEVSWSQLNQFGSVQQHHMLQLSPFFVFSSPKQQPVGDAL